jgi:hypothetical protein
VHGDHDGVSLTDRLAADRPGVLDRHGVELLRHDAARLHEAVSEPDVVHFRRAPQQQILHEASEARERDGRRVAALKQYIETV